MSTASPRRGTGVELTTGAIAAAKQAAKSSKQFAISQRGARGQQVERHEKGSWKSRSFWALIAARNRKEVKETMIQHVKNEELVMATSQLRTMAPPAVLQVSNLPHVATGAGVCYS